jgi:hypothetical protein
VTLSVHVDAFWGPFWCPSRKIIFVSRSTVARSAHMVQKIVLHVLLIRPSLHPSVHLCLPPPAASQTSFAPLLQMLCAFHRAKSQRVFAAAAADAAIAATLAAAAAPPVLFGSIVLSLGDS